ncbi:RNase H family protein [Glutamicibacter sp. NPDC087344]|uniref:RNase H family protein n=1 Tax=Glutamicibacter sp. NPDC087344 TaxID=3363994 RepID=UPI0037F514D4
MTTPRPRPQNSIIVDSDGVRRLASETRQAVPTRLIAVLERVAHTVDSTGAKYAYVPFTAGIVMNGYLAQRSEQGLRFDFAITLCDSTSKPLATLTGSSALGSLDQAILKVIAEFTGTVKITQAASIDLVLPHVDGLGLADVGTNAIFCLNPSWLFGVDLELPNQANLEALAPVLATYRSQRARVIAYTDGSVPRFGLHRGAGAMVTTQGHWAARVSPKGSSRDSLMAEATGSLLALQHAPLDLDLTIFTDCRALVYVINNLAEGRYQSGKEEYTALRVPLEKRTGKTRAQWVRGHNGNPYNEAADRMAVLMARHFNAGIDPNLSHSLMSSIVSEELRRDRQAR